MFSANSPAEFGSLDLLRTALEEAGIPCMVKNELLTIGKGDIPATECVPELWIMKGEDYPTARGIMDQWNAANKERHADWVCANCKEPSEGQFTSCWKCGTERE